MIVLLGSSGHYGSAFAAELRRHGQSFIPLTRTAFDYTRFDYLFDYLRTMRPEFLINAAGSWCPPEQDGLEKPREQCMVVNALLPQMIARVCLMTKTPWGHVSSGSVYCGAKIMHDEDCRVERDLGRSDMQKLFVEQPQRFRGFSELDEPNFSFRFPPCAFYSGTKALAEEAIRNIGQSYIWRMRLPFNEKDVPCNYLTQLQHQSVVPDAIDSLSHTEDCVRACLELWKIRAPYGIYNVVNPGAVSVRGTLEVMGKTQATSKATVPEPNRVPESHCILDATKLLATGVKIRPVEEALQDSVHKMRQATRSGPAATKSAARPATSAPI